MWTCSGSVVLLRKNRRQLCCVVFDLFALRLTIFFLCLRLGFFDFQCVSELYHHATTVVCVETKPKQTTTKQNQNKPVNDIVVICNCNFVQMYIYIDSEATNGRQLDCSQQSIRFSRWATFAVDSKAATWRLHSNERWASVAIRKIERSIRLRAQSSFGLFMPQVAFVSIVAVDIDGRYCCVICMY